jgi:O-antigen ligase
LDLAGILLFAGAALWVMLSAIVAGGEPQTAMTAVVAVGLAFAAGCLIGAIAGSVSVAGACAFGIVLAVAPSLQSVVGGRPLSGPLGYANANGALLLQGVIALLVVGTSARDVPMRLIIAGLVVAIGVVILLSQVYAAAILLVLPLAVAFIRRPGRKIVEVCAAIVILAVAGSTTVAALAGGQGPSTGASIAGGRRASLWEAAFDLMVQHPIVGVGPGRFAEFAVPASADPDARWAHNEFLELGAETGIVGAVLVLALFAYGFLRLWVVADATLAAPLAATSLAVLGVHAAYDYVLHFPAVPMAAAALVGAATARDARGRHERLNVAAERDTTQDLFATGTIGGDR